MPRFLIDRVWEPMDEARLQKYAATSKHLIETQFADMVWEKSHVAIGDDGEMHSFCIYEAPSRERIEEHSGVLGAHRIETIYEIAGEVSPSDFPS